MNNNLQYSIEIVPKGFDQISKLPQVVSSVNTAVVQMNSSFASVDNAFSPFDKLMKVLTNIEKILGGIGRVSVESFNKLDDILVTNTNGFQKCKDHAEKLDKQIEQIGKSSSKAGTEVKEGLLDRLAKFGQAFMGIKSAAQTVWGAISPIFEEGMMRQNAETDFSTILGIPDPEEAKKVAKEYADGLRSTDTAALYGTSTVNEGAKSMIAYGVDPETTFQMMESLGDLAMGDKQKLSSLSTAFSQMWSLGKLQTQDWKQMVGAGFNPFMQMQKDLGKTTEQLDEMMSKGKISADMVKDAFIHATQIAYTDKNGKKQYTFDEQVANANKKDGTEIEKGMYFGAMTNTMNNTLTGALATLSGAFDDLKAKAFETLTPIAVKVVGFLKDKLIPIINRLMPVLEGVASIVGGIINFISDHIETIEALAVAIGVVVGVVKAWMAVQTVLNAILTANPVGVVVMAIAALVAIVAVCIEKWEEWGQVVIMLMGPFGWIVSAVVNIKKHWDSIVSAFQSEGIIGGIKRIGAVLLDVVLAPLSKILGYVSNLTGWKWAKNLQQDVEAMRLKIVGKDLSDIVKDPEKETESSTQTDLENAVNLGNGSGGKGLKETAGKKTEKVATGGTRNTQITITLDNLIGTMAFNGGYSENREQVEGIATESLLRVLYAAYYAAE
ncbi:MAG: tape measure protein [Bacteroidales bacterium]|nr:tape measure protein [Bacteroidales bacterium]